MAASNAGGASGAGAPASTLLPYGALALTALLWSGNWIVGRGLTDQVAPFALSFWRWVLAVSILLPFTARLLWRQRDVIRAEWRRLLVFSFLGITMFNASIYYGLKTTTAINGALVNSASPIFVIIISWFGLGDRSTLRQGVGVVVSLLGVAAILSRGDPQALMTLSFGTGDLIITAAIFVWALYTILLRHWPTELNQFAFIAFIMTVGLLFMVPAYLIERSIVGDFELTARALGGIVYLGIFASIGAYICWNYGVRSLGAGTASLFLHLVPPFAAVAAMLLLDEALRLYHLAGITLILLGIYIASATRPFWRRWLARR